MRLVRELEQKIESVLDGVAGRVFRGSLHPSELAAKLVRVADLSLTDTPTGPLAANAFVITVNPGDIADTASRRGLQIELARLLEEAAFERGWRLEGPAEVSLRTDVATAPGSASCTAEVRPGSRPAWALLRGATPLEVTRNRSLIGRGERADVVVADDRVSRIHALLWTEDGRVLVRDLGSANGTLVDGIPVTDRPAELRPGSVLTLGPVGLRFERR